MTDDTRDPQASLEEPTATLDATALADEAAPTADPVDWEAKARNLERLSSNQGRELGMLRQQLTTIEQRMAAIPQPEPETVDYDELPAPVRQELDYYRRQMADVERQQVAMEYGPDFDQALDTFDRAMRLDPSRRGKANAVAQLIAQLVSGMEAAAPPPPPRPRPTAPTRSDSNRPDPTPPADLNRLQAEAEQRHDPRSLASYIGALRRASGG